MCVGKTPRGVVRMGLLHAAAALKRDGSVSAHPFFLSKSKPFAPTNRRAMEREYAK